MRTVSPVLASLMICFLWGVAFWGRQSRRVPGDARSLASAARHVNPAEGLCSRCRTLPSPARLCQCRPARETSHASQGLRFRRLRHPLRRRRGGTACRGRAGAGGAGADLAEARGGLAAQAAAIHLAAGHHRRSHAWEKNMSEQNSSQSKESFVNNATAAATITRRTLVPRIPSSSRRDRSTALRRGPKRG